jgi:ATP-binding protein involved in chromosome partitioning
VVGAQLTRAIAVASGKGGVGKSTVALNLAAALARRPARVGLLDADLYGPDIPRMLGLSREARATGLDLWIKGDPKKTKVPVVERYGLKIASVQFLIAEDQSISFNSALVGLLLRRLAGADWGELDFLIIDLPPGTADIQQQVATMVNLVGVLLVVTPQDVAHLDARKLLDMLDNRGLPVIGAVENMAWMACPHCGEHMSVFPTTAESRTIWSKVERLAQLPMEPELALAAERGVLADGSMSALFDALAADVVGRLDA